MTERGIIKIMTDVPGPKSRQLYREVEQNVPKGVGHQTPIAVSSARGATITDVDGNTYLDFAGGIGVLNVGHCPDQVVKAIKEQADNYLHACFHVVIYEPYIRLANKPKVAGILNIITGVLGIIWTILDKYLISYGKNKVMRSEKSFFLTVVHMTSVQVEQKVK